MEKYHSWIYVKIYGNTLSFIFNMESHISGIPNHPWNNLIGNCHILGIIIFIWKNGIPTMVFSIYGIPTDELSIIFQNGRSTTNQLSRKAFTIPAVLHHDPIFLWTRFFGNPTRLQYIPQGSLFFHKGRRNQQK